jgi:hypothetical protein
MTANTIPVVGTERVLDILPVDGADVEPDNDREADNDPVDARAGIDVVPPLVSIDVVGGDGIGNAINVSQSGDGLAQLLYRCVCVFVFERCVNKHLRAKIAKIAKKNSLPWSKTFRFIAILKTIDVIIDHTYWHVHRTYQQCTAPN